MLCHTLLVSAVTALGVLTATGAEAQPPTAHLRRRRELMQRQQLPDQNERETLLWQIHKCPPLGGSPVSVTPGYVTLEVNPDENLLCMLVLTDGVDTLFPVARSYAGNDWEEFLRIGRISLIDDAAISCFDGGTLHICDFVLPSPLGTIHDGMYYELRSSNYTLPTARDEYARFLEQSTFGPTRSALDELETDPLYSLDGNSVGDPLDRMALWIQAQQDETVTPPSYHRTFYRQRANARFESSGEWGQVTHPCQEDALFRKFALTDKHKNRQLTITRLAGTEWRVLSVDGHDLTVVEGPLYHDSADDSNNVFADDSSHLICQGADSGVGGEFRLWSSFFGSCKEVIIGDASLGQTPLYGNPVVQFPPGTITPVATVPLDGVTVAADTEYFASRTPSVQILRAPSGLSGTACNAIVMDSGTATPLIGTTFNTATNQLEYWLSDPRFNYLDNTLEQPLADGGGSIVVETGGTDFAAQCSNVPRSFINEDSCILSYSPNACSNTLLHKDTSAGVLVCGSPNEVSNDLSLDGETLRGAFDTVTVYNETTGFTHFRDQRQVVWTSLAVWSSDQLRQRVAWALAQILVVNESIEANSVTENWAHFYDTFVRHAFGNYRDVLKEVSFSRMMGHMLTYMGSTSTGYEWNKNQVLEYADENYAREIMQLFTIGLYELGDDGIRKRDDNGNFFRTYTSDDIMEYARAWTGLSGEAYRGNIPDGNRIDPMKVEPAHRDFFPKMGLGKQYIGHGYPLCADLPAQSFLKVGSKYRLMGSSSQTEVGTPTLNAWVAHDNLDSFKADPTGELYEALCAPNATGHCAFPSIVHLGTNLACSGDECEVDTVGSVFVADGIYYEYVQPACVHQAYYENARKIKKRYWYTYKAAFMCADPRTAVAATAFCLDQGASHLSRVDDVYWGERYTFATAQARADELTASDSRYALCTSTGDLVTKYGKTQPYATPFLWMGNNPCHLLAKINPDGRVSLVHSVPDEEASWAGERTKRETDLDSKTFFRVDWSNETDAKALALTCPAPSCEFSPDGFCMCHVDVQETVPYDANALPTKADVLGQLAIGAFHPHYLDVSYDTSVTTEGVTVYTLPDSSLVFEVVDDFGEVQRRKNLVSIVSIQGQPGLTFPNPVHFMSPAEPTVRDALYEIDATIDQVFYHRNTAPFLATRLAQRFSVSNPTARLVKEIATAFRTGTYTYVSTDGSVSLDFGSGKYGDMAAAVAATLLDRESRNVLLDSDPGHGSARENLIKIIHVMRALEFQTTPEYPLPRFFKDLQATIGQEAFEAPSVFSYVDDDFQPDGSISRAGMVAPELQILAGPQMIGLINGLMAMVKYGADRCFGGFGQTLNYHWTAPNCEDRVPGQFVNMSGYLDYAPASPATATASIIVDELATLLTSGRMDPDNRQLIRDVVDTELNGSGDMGYAIIKAQELMVASSEFHTTGINKKTGTTRPSLSQPTPTNIPYKAVVMVMLKGGCDSYNMIVPKTCAPPAGSTTTLVDQYESVRGSLGLTSAERSITIDVDATQGQPCSQFALHPNLPMLKELYDESELSFFMNAGVLNEPVTKDDYEAKTLTQLFAHNHMILEMQAVDPYDEEVRTGVLGRLTKALNLQGYNASALTIDKLCYAVYGDVEDKVNSPTPVVMSRFGADRFNSKPQTETYDPVGSVRSLNGVNEMGSSLYGESFSDAFMDAIDFNDLLADALDEAVLTDSCGSRELNTIAKLMQTHAARGKDRDVFYTELGGFDHHKNLKDNLATEFADLNEALECFVQNVKDVGLWPNVTLVVVSDFGRTLTSNSQDGSDHGWGGNYFCMGGDLDESKRFFGAYPDDLTEDGPLNVGRGRMIPTLSSESIWSPIVEWMGVLPGKVPNVLPNGVGAGTPLFRASDLYR